MYSSWDRPVAFWLCLGRVDQKQIITEANTRHDMVGAKGDLLRLCKELVRDPVEL